MVITAGPVADAVKLKPMVLRMSVLEARNPQLSVTDPVSIAMVKFPPST
jgi:hypothetical protein